jgi:aspartate/tyrosine/aromatic aminotransferase
LDHEYAPIQGLDAFVSSATQLAYGATSDAIVNKKVISRIKSYPTNYLLVCLPTVAYMTVML